MSDSNAAELVLEDEGDGEKLYVARDGRRLSFKLERHDDYGYIGVTLSPDSVSRLRAFLRAAVSLVEEPKP